VTGRVLVTARCRTRGHMLAGLLATPDGLHVHIPHTAVGHAKGSRVVNRRGGQPRGSNARLRARCPVHGSRGGTLAVSQGPAGALVKCHAQCETADVLAALGLSWQHLFDQPRERKAGWKPRRPGPSPAEHAGRVIARAIHLMQLRQDIAAAAWRGPRLSAEERLELAECGGQQDADAHYRQTLARYAALAWDPGYVRRAYADLKAYRAGTGHPPMHEQICVLVTRAEDLGRLAVRP
jgi:hypothetical protein